MPKYGNPDRPNQYESEVSDMIHKVARSIEDWLRERGHVPGPGIRIDSDLYYADDAQPSRFLEVRLGPNSSIRFGVQRNIKRRHPWTVGWNFYTKGTSIQSGEFDARGISQIAPEVTNHILTNYEYLLA